MNKTNTILLDTATTPHHIEERSFAIIDAEIPSPRPYDGPLWQVARRMIHTVGDTDLLPHIKLSEKALTAGMQALQNGCTIFTDTEMARCGMVARRLNPLGVRSACMLHTDGVESYAKTHSCTRSRAAIMLLAAKFGGNIVAIGNAPTALLALLDVLNAGATPPALIIGMPVGFVNAAESKELLHISPYTHMTVLGRRGGSPLVASVVNALADLVMA